MKFTVSLPAPIQPEQEWIVRFLLGEILGFEFVIKETQTLDVLIEVQEKVLVISSVFFGLSEQQQNSIDCLPSQPFSKWNPVKSGLQAELTSPQIVVLYGKALFEMHSTESASLGLDVFGSAFVVLSQLEERLKTARDEHHRFSSSDSFLVKANILERPIVEEYANVLYAAMLRLWPRISRKREEGKVNVTCDVDHPFSDYANTWARTIKKMGGDLVRRKSVNTAVKSFQNTWNSKKGNFSSDPFNTFSWIMDQNEKAGNQVTFYFMAGVTDELRDGNYDLLSPRICGLLLEIDQRGHKIGLHGSYLTYNRPDLFEKEVSVIERALDLIGSKQNLIETRQHYLRWSLLETPLMHQNAGFQFDSSVGFAELPGFRVGTGRTHSSFSHISRKPLLIKQKPLILMEASVLDEPYMALSYNESTLDLMLRLKTKAKQFGGSFTILWHNCHFLRSEDQAFYQELIR